MYVVKTKGLISCAFVFNIGVDQLRLCVHICKKQVFSWHSSFVSVSKHSDICTCTVMILNFWTDRSAQTVLTKIRLLLEEQSD